MLSDEERLEPTHERLLPTPRGALVLLYLDRIGPLHQGDIEHLPGGLEGMLQRVDAPVGPLFVLGVEGRRYLGYKNPWKPLSMRYVTRRFATRRLIEELRRERPLVYKERFRGSVLLRDVVSGERLLVAGYPMPPSKPTLLELFRKGRELGARVTVAFDRPRGGRPFNLVRQGAVEFRRLRELPELPAMTLELVTARP
ncbi:hypothetical protein Ocepr_2349 (plasmid) [Oceanithermus profundus DSM 14977]|uniref:Uncharacterized protein n=1 Tax=Oceanithermus profundus (strain DSM 14977 / NBRC 100410 / VKM B-2274 / 506) TaxID=670487 RepID=E4UAL8_OCEP5|nr:hypothetical protein Ocepr_2349 [Oceanithermus profundus DSM 14977]